MTTRPFRPAFIDERINFTLQRQRHARTAPPECRCVYCLSTAEIEAEFRARLAAQRQANGEAPF